jgi:hypothetical protein
MPPPYHGVMSTADLDLNISIEAVSSSFLVIAISILIFVVAAVPFVSLYLSTS